MTMPMSTSGAPLLSLRALSIQFEKRRSLSDTLARRPQQVVSAVNGIDLDVMPGETPYQVQLPPGAAAPGAPANPASPSSTSAPWHPCPPADSPPCFTAASNISLNRS